MRSMVNTITKKKPRVGLKKISRVELEGEYEMLKTKYGQIREAYNKAEEMMRSMFSSSQSMARENEELRTQLKSMKKRPTKLTTTNINKSYYFDCYRKASNYWEVGFHLTWGVATGLCSMYLVVWLITKLLDIFN